MLKNLSDKIVVKYFGIENKILCVVVFSEVFYDFSGVKEDFFYSGFFDRKVFVFLDYREVLFSGNSEMIIEIESEVLFVMIWIDFYVFSLY